MGTGYQMADTMLRWRNVTQFSTIPEVLYALYEAKKFGERSPQVGKLTAMVILQPNPDSSIRSRMVSKRGMDDLEDQFTMYGPKPWNLRGSSGIDWLFD